MQRLVVILAACATPACANLSPPPLGEPEAEQPPVVRQRFLLPAPGDDVVGEMQVVVARAEDTLLDIARHFDLGYNEITAANPGVDPWLPGEGTRVVVPTRFILPPGPREGVVVNVAAMRLFYFPETPPGEMPIVVTHPVGVGRVDWATPTGKTRIVSKVENPSWTVPASIRREHALANDPLPAVVPPGPDNPLGEYAMRLGMREYLIHGTNKPWGVGMRISHGCIRMYPEDIEPLFAEIPIGTPVRLVKSPYVVGRHGGALYVAAHALFEEDVPESGDGTQAALEAIVQAAEDTGVAVDRQKALGAVRAARGYPLPVSPGTPDESTIVANARRVANPLRPEEEPAAPSAWRSLLGWLGTQ